MTQVATAETTVAKKKKPKTDARAFREAVTKLATSLLSDWVGEARAAEATGRIASALAAAAGASRNPKDIYECTQESIGQCIAVAALSGIMPSTGRTSLAYLIPRRPRRGEKPQLTYNLSHRGINALARRCGQMMIAVPISYRDKIAVTEEVKVIERDVDDPPMDFDELRGVMVVIKETESGLATFRGWVPKKIIASRRDESDAFKYAESNDQSSDPWHKHPVEMAMKTAMHYAVSRGWCAIDDTEAVRALSAPAFDESAATTDDAPLVLDVTTTPSTVGELFSEGDQAGESSPPETGSTPGGEPDAAAQPEETAVAQEMLTPLELGLQLISESSTIENLDDAMNELQVAEFTAAERKKLQTAYKAAAKKFA